MRSLHWRVGVRAAGRPIVLVVTAVVGLGVPFAHIVARQPPFAFNTAPRAEEAFAGLRARLAPGERVGVLLASANDDDDMALWYSAQYALAPAIVTPIHARECLRARPTPRCPLDRVERVAFAPRNPRALPILDVLGLVTVERQGSLHLTTWRPGMGDVQVSVRDAR